MDLLYNIILAIIGFSSGLIVAGGIFAFIAIIGIVPRLAQRTKTVPFIPLYEDAIIIGGIFGATTLYIDYYLPIGRPIVAFLGLCSGIFIGCLAVSLAEVLDVIPVFTRRTRITQGLPVLITAIALGKMIGSLLYFYIKGFYVI